MSRLITGYYNERKARALWMQVALTLQMAALVGCNTAGGSNLLVTSKSMRAPSNQTLQARLPSAPDGRAKTQAATMSLRDDNISISKPQRNEIAQVAYEEQIDSHQNSMPIATLASCQVSGSCSPTCGESCGCGAAGANCQLSGPTTVDIQEYLFDGGDMDPSLVVRHDATVAGLNPTDTVAYYETYDGKLCVTPTNRVPIYAPRFGAVRQVSGVFLSEHSVSTERILAPVMPARFDDQNLASSVVLPVAPQGEEKVSLIDALRDRNSGIPIAQVLPPHRMSDAIVPFEAIDFFRTGILQEKDIAVLGQFFQNARTWETPESLEVLIDGQEAAIALDVKQAQDVHVYELPPGKCSLRICKAASHMIANSGDEISFTIRFDNIGTHPIQKVVILDSLSPRLEYIEDSQQCSLTPLPEFLAEPNEVGAMALRWEFKSAIKPGEGGVLHFRCLVR